MHITCDGVNLNKFPPPLKFILTLGDNDCGNLDINRATSLFPSYFQKEVQNRLQELQSQNEFNKLNGKGTGLWVIFELDIFKVIDRPDKGPWIYPKTEGGEDEDQDGNSRTIKER